MILLDDHKLVLISSMTLLLSTILSPTLGAIIGAFIALWAAARQPLCLVPILMFAAAYQLISVSVPLQFGWIVVLGAFAGLMLRIALQSGRIKVDPYFAVVAAVFVTIGMLSSLIGEEGRLDRLATLTMLLFVVSYLVAYDFSDLIRLSASPEISLLIAVASGAAIITIFIFAALHLDLASNRRTTELAIGFGEGETSSSNISRVLGFAMTGLVVTALTLRGVRLQTRLFLIGASLIAFVGMIYAGSRMPVFAATAAILLGTFWAFRAASGAIRVASLLLGCVILAGMAFTASTLIQTEAIKMPFVDQEISLRIAREAPVASNVRLLAWQSYLEGLPISKFALGSGVGSFGNPHSVLFGSFVTFGIFGAVAVLFALVYLILKGGRRGFEVSGPLMLYLLLAYSSSSDIDRTQFWILLSISFLIVNARKPLIDTNSSSWTSDRALNANPTPLWRKHTR